MSMDRLAMLEQAFAELKRLFINHTHQGGEVDRTRSLPAAATTGGFGGVYTLGYAEQNFGFGFTSYFDTTTVPSGTETDVGNFIPVAGTLQNLTIGVYSNSLDASAVFTLYKNGSPTTLTVTISAGSTTTTIDSTHTVSVAAGDRISIEAAIAGTSGSITCGFTYQLV